MWAPIVSYLQARALYHHKSGSNPILPAGWNTRGFITNSLGPIPSSQLAGTVEAKSSTVRKDRIRALTGGDRASSVPACRKVRIEAQTGGDNASADNACRKYGIGVQHH